MSGRREIVYYARMVQRSKKTRIELGDRIMSFSFEDDERKADKLSLVVDNWDLRNFDNKVWKKGNVIEFSWGYIGNMAPARQVTITKVTGSTQLKVEGVSKMFVMDRVPRSETYHNVTRSEVATSIARNYGYGQDFSDIEETENVITQISQPHITDAKFLRRLANKEGFEFFIDFDGFHFHSRKTEQVPSREYTWYTDKTGTIMSFNIENDMTVRPGLVRVKGRNLLTKEDHTQDLTPTQKLAASPDVIGSIDAAKAAMTNKDSSKAEKQKGAIFLLNAQFEKAGKQQTAATAAVVAQQAARVEVQATSEQEAVAAKKKAAGKLRRKKELTIKMTVKAIGDPSLIAKSVLRVSGIGERLSGNYYVKSIKHSVGSSGYVSDIKLIRDGINRVSARLFYSGGGGGSNFSLLGYAGVPKCREHVAAELRITNTLWGLWKSEAGSYANIFDALKIPGITLNIRDILTAADKLKADPYNARASDTIFKRCLRLQGLLKKNGPTHKAITRLRMPAAVAVGQCDIALNQRIGAAAAANDDRAVTIQSIEQKDGRTSRKIITKDVRDISSDAATDERFIYVSKRGRK